MQELKAGAAHQRKPLDEGEMLSYDHRLCGAIRVAKTGDGLVTVRINTLGDPTWENGTVIEGVNALKFALALLKEAGPLTADEKLTILKAIDEKKAA